MLTNHGAKSVAETMGLVPGPEADAHDGQLAIEMAAERDSRPERSMP